MRKLKKYFFEEFNGENGQEKRQEWWDTIGQRKSRAMRLSPFERE